MRVPKLQIDTYQAMAIMAVVRTGPRELAKLREAIAGKRPFGAQTRLLLELAARGHVDLTALVEASQAAVKP